MLAGRTKREDMAKISLPRSKAGRLAGRPKPPEHGAKLPPGLKLNLGCGPVQPAGWVNIDARNRAILASRAWPLDCLLVRLGVLPSTEFGPNVKVHDLQKPLPYEDQSVACIYAGEVWEHFRYDDAARLTRECLRVLTPGGVLRVCVPDGAEFWRRYLEIYQEQVAQARDRRRAEPLRAHVSMYFHDIATSRQWLGSIGHTHKWQFDEVQLVELFETTGFARVERRPFHQSLIPDVDAVESSDFLIVEGVKA
jgi:predicted SAM-dependent methyltransferase